MYQFDECKCVCNAYDVWVSMNKKGVIQLVIPEGKDAAKTLAREREKHGSKAM